MTWFQHKHKWKAVAAQSAMVPRYAGMFAQTEGMPRPCTHVLLRCSCGFVMTETIEGNWSIGDINGESAADAVDKLLLSTGRKQP